VSLPSWSLPTKHRSLYSDDEGSDFDGWTRTKRRHLLECDNHYAESIGESNESEDADNNLLTSICARIAQSALRGSWRAHSALNRIRW
jgi:hypothetical protein